MMRFLGFLTLSLSLSLRTAQACENASTTADLRLAIEELEAAYIALDIEGVRGRLDALEVLMPCLQEAIPRTDATRYHRAQGLGAFINRDSESASQAFLAARSIEPDAPLPSSLIPEGHPVQRLYAERSLDDLQAGPLPEPVDSYLVLDGRQADQRPLSHPVIFQRIETSGNVAQSAYLWPDDPLPSFAVAPPAPEGVAVEAALADALAEPTEAVQESAGSSTEPAVAAPERTKRGSEPRGQVAVLVGTGAAAAATGALFIINRVQYGQYYSDTTTYDELNSMRNDANRSAAATISTAALTAAGGLALVLVW